MADAPFGYLAPDVGAALPEAQGAGSPVRDILARLPLDTLKSLASTVMGPGQLSQPNPYPPGSEEASWYEDQRQKGAVDWGREAAFNLAGISTPFAPSGAVGALGGKLRGYKAMDSDVTALNPETGLSHVALDRPIAEQFSQGGKRRIHEVEVTTNKPFDYRDPADLGWLTREMEKPENVAAYNRDTKAIMGPGYDYEHEAGDILAGLHEGAYQSYEVPHVSKMIRDRGYDGIYMNEDFQKGQPNLAVFDPGQIKLGGKVGALGAAPDAPLGAGLESKYPGLKLDVSTPAKSGDYGVVSRIVVPEEMRGKGVGTQAMRDLIAEADARGVPLALSPSADFGGSKARLVDFYKRLGFGKNIGANKDFATRETMIRPVKGEK